HRYSRNAAANASPVLSARQWCEEVVRKGLCGEANRLVEVGGEPDAARVLSLRCRRARAAAQAANAHAVQLLDLPALRRAVDVLLPQSCAPGAGAALAGGVCAGRSQARV